MKRLRVPALLEDFSRSFSDAGFQCWLVGGAVRDMVMGREPGDYDVATDAKPEQVMALFRSVIPTGIKHGTVTVHFRGRPVEVTTFRTERGYADGRHPDEVLFTRDIEVDLERRDFTMNALALDCRSGELKDPHGGEADIGRRLIRAIGEARERFTEDGLRPLRALRFASVLGFSLEKATLDAIRPCLEVSAKVSAERVRDELSKILLSERPDVGLRLMSETGLLALFLPELETLRGLEQSPPHAFDALEHSLVSCAGSRPILSLRWAALLHDCGKREAMNVEDSGLIHFHGHERSSSRMAREALSRLKYPNALVERVSVLVLHHMTRYDPSWTDAALRRLVSRVGRDFLDELLELLEADEFGLEGRPRPHSLMGEFRDRLAAVMGAEAAFSLKDLAIGGRELSGIGYRSGPPMGLALKALLEAVLEDPALNEKSRLLEIARNLGEREGWIEGP